MLHKDKVNVSTLLIGALGAIFIYTIGLAFIPVKLFIAILNGIFIGITVAVAIVYMPLICWTMRQKNFDRVSQLAIGIGCLWAGLFGNRVWALYNRLYGNASDALNSPVVAAMIFIAIAGGILFVTAPGYPPVGDYTSDHEPWGGKNRNLLISLSTIGGISTFALSFFLGYHF